MNKEKKEKIQADWYNGSNGIVICCKSCGTEFEETDQGHYSPIEFEHERYDRKCKQCRYYDEY